MRDAVRDQSKARRGSKFSSLRFKAVGLPSRPIGLPQSAMWVLSAFIFVTGGALLLPLPPTDVQVSVFRAFRQPDGHLFFEDRLVRAAVMYGWLHALPGIIWCATIPLQHVRYIRQKYPTAHRWSGWIAITSSFVLSVTGLLMAPRKLSYTHPRSWHIHRLRLGAGKDPITVMAWPTFEAATSYLGPALAFTAYKTVYYARKRDFANHARWAEMCTLVGEVVPLQRVGMMFIGVIGILLPLLPSQVQSYLRVPDDLAGKADAELAAFAWTGWAATAVILTFAVRKSVRLRSSHDSKAE